MRYLAALLMGLSILALAQQPTDEPSAKQQPAEADCKDMMAKMQQQRAAMKQMDERLQTGLERMNEASGDAKVDAVAAVVTILAQQRIQMHERMMSMNEDRSQHMMGHMQQGGKGMMDCPMMAEKTESTERR